MPKSKQSPPRKSSPSSEKKEEDLTQKLCDLALDLAEQEDSESANDSLRQKDSELTKLVKRTLFQKKDEILYSALEQAKYADIDAYRLLKERIEEASEVIITAGSDGKNVEVNAFIIPLFVYSQGGLQVEDCFEDQEAFELLSASLQKAELESADAKVVLVNHAYHLDEIDSITFSHVGEMVREAHASIDNMHKATTSAIDRSFSGWPEHHFSPDDQAVELRFLLGFASKTTDDAFYRIPQDEAAADAYFETRAKRFEDWTEQITPIVKRCLVADNSDIEVRFLYQDLFHGGKERGIDEYFMLQMLSELNHALDQHGVDAAATKAIIGPMETGDDVVLRIQLYALADNVLLASSDKPVNLGSDLEAAILDIADALAALGITTLSAAAKFDAAGQPIEVRTLQ